MKSDLVRIHHADYVDDIPFWIGSMNNLDPILEIGCGHGRVTLPLLEAGYQLIGIDRDEEPLVYLKNFLSEVDKETRQRISLVQADILDYQPQFSFGGVILPCNTYSTFSPDDKPRLIRKVYSWLKDGGLFIISLPNPHQTWEIIAELRATDQIAELELEKVITHPETGFPVQVSSRLRAADKSLLWDWIYDHLHSDGYVERLEVTVEHFLSTQEEILAGLEKGGFIDVICQGDFGGEGFAEDSPYLILICRK